MPEPADDATESFDDEAVQQAEAEAVAVQQLQSMTDDDVMSASVKRVCKETERLTRRNMKDCVSEYIQTKCLDDPAFARQTMHPQKNMIRCFKYINRQALEFIKSEMADNDEKPIGNGVGSDIPDDLCYKWAEDYFLDPDAKEDKETEDKFVPKPYSGGSAVKSKKKEPKKEKKEPAKPPVPEPPQQISLEMGV